MEQILSAQERFFADGGTSDVAFRRGALERLEQALRRNEADLLAALKNDLGKGEEEAYLSELFLVYLELKHARRKLKKWMKPRSAQTPLFHLPGRSYVRPRPRGRVLILAPWNYPVYLLLIPLIGAVAAGNCVVVRSSGTAPATARVCGRIIEEAFSREHVEAAIGDRSVARELLAQRHDLIFFTGSAAVGRTVMRAAAEHLTPVVLELGGKSPCIVDADVDIKYAARRIAWGKYLNAGQTCVAPDYLLVDKKIAEPLADAIRGWVVQFYGEKPHESPDYARIVGRRQLERLEHMLEGADVIFGGGVDRRQLFVEPTLVRCSGMDDAPMKEEIFGPILPMIAYETLTDAVGWANQRPNPLALYVFSRRKRFCAEVIERIPAGGATVNDTIAHLTAHDLPFGGVGQSGMGAYHGRHSFDVFSHLESVLWKPGVRFDVPFRYPPFKKKRRWFGWVRRYYA